MGQRAPVWQCMGAVVVSLMSLPSLAAVSPVEGVPAVVLADWTAVLQTVVNTQGQVDFAALRRDPRALARVVNYIGSVSPASAPNQFPTQASKLSYYINAYNALAMHNVIDSGIPQRLMWWRRVWFFGVKRFQVGGESMSLYTLENEVIRPLGDERIHFALNCMVVGCPRLPRQPFLAGSIDVQLDQAARLFFSEPRNLRIDEAARSIHVSAILEFYTADFLHRSKTLVEYVNRYAARPAPVSWPVEFIPYDWTVNTQPR